MGRADRQSFDVECAQFALLLALCSRAQDTHLERAGLVGGTGERQRHMFLGQHMHGSAAGRGDKTLGESA